MKKQLTSLVLVLILCLSLPVCAFAGNARVGTMMTGLEITDVQLGGPASKAGIKAGDVLEAIDGSVLENYDEFSEKLDQYNAGETAVYTVQRNGEKLDLTVTFGDKESPRIEAPVPDDDAASLSQEEAYQAMVEAYREGEYEKSYSLYAVAFGYEDADKYGNLLKARLYGEWMLKSEAEELEKLIVEDVSFEDAADVLVLGSPLAHYYLLGYWTAKGGMQSFEVKEKDGWCTSTLPKIPYTGGHYTISEGVYWRYDNWEDRVAQWEFHPISEKQMEIFANQTGQTFTFTKVR